MKDNHKSVTFSSDDSINSKLTHTHTTHTRTHACTHTLTHTHTTHTHTHTERQKWTREGIKHFTLFTLVCSQSSALSAYMPWWGGQFFLAVGPPATRSDDCLVAMKVNLCLKLVPQFVMLCTSHVSTQQLDLLYSGTHTQ